MSLDGNGLLHIDDGKSVVDEDFSPENMDKVMQKLHSMEDDGAPIVIEGMDDDGSNGSSDDAGNVGNNGQASDTDLGSGEQTLDGDNRQDVSGQQQQQAQLPETIEIDGQQVSVAYLQELTKFDSFLKNNPVAAERMQKAFNPQYDFIDKTQPVAPVVEAPKPKSISDELPEDFDAEDPGNQFILQKLQSIDQQQARINDFLASQKQQEDSQLIGRGAADFNKSYPMLNDDDLTAIRNKAVEFDTIDRLAARGVSIDAATKQSLEYAMWSIPNLRDKVLNTQAANDQAAVDQAAQQASVDKQRQSKLSAISGGNGSSGRALPKEPVDNNPRRVPAGMVADIREAIANGGAG